MSVAWARGAFSGLVLLGCGAHSPAHSAQPAPGPAAVPAQTAKVEAPSTAGNTTPSAEPKASENAGAPRPCGALDCLAFSTPRAAFERVLATGPQILAIGEAHAQEGSSNIHSSTRRFAEQLLPLLAGKAKHLVIELLVANCKAKTVERVAKTQAPVTEHQAKNNQNEFLTLGKYAQRFGIEPQALTPSCAEYESVTAAGEDGVARLLGLIAQKTESSVRALLAQPHANGELIVTYGGALHNDLSPRPGQEGWSFGPQLAAESHGQYVELDLIVPEFVKDTEAWRAMPWFPAFDREHLSDETLLFRPGANSFVLIFPKTEPTPAQQR